MNEDERDAKRKRGGMSVLMTQKVVSKILLNTGAPLKQTKGATLAFMDNHESSYYGVLASKTVKGKDFVFHLPTYVNEQDFIVHRGTDFKIESVEFKKFEIQDGDLGIVAVSWNFKNERYICASYDKDLKLWTVIPAAVLVEKEVTVSGADGEEQSITKYVAIYETYTQSFFSSKELLKEFFCLDYVTVADFGKLGNAVETAKRSDHSLSSADYTTTKDLITKMEDTSISEGVLSLATLLFSFSLRSATLEEKIEAFESRPSVILGTSLKIKSLSDASVVNVKNGEAIQSLLLKDVGDDDLVVMAKVNISQTSWDKITDLDAIRVIKCQPDIAAMGKKSKHKPKKAQTFETMKASLVKRVVKAIIKKKKERGETTTVQTVRHAPSLDLIE